MTFFGVSAIASDFFSDPIIGLLPRLALVAIFYILVIMPMQRQKPQHTTDAEKTLENRGRWC